MKKYFSIILVCFIAGTFGCSNSSNNLEKFDVNMFLETLSSSPKEIIPKESLPIWLIEKVNEMEKEPLLKFFKIKIFTGEWNKRKYYLIIHPLSSCMFCDIYSEKGEKKIFSADNNTEKNSFFQTCKNWTLIYEYGGDL